MITRTLIGEYYSIRCAGETTLQQIANALGVSTDAFNTGLQTHLFFTEANGSEWFLVQEPMSVPHVRRVTAQSVISDLPSPAEADATIAEFFAKNWNKPQSQALAAIVESLLKAHLTLSAVRKSE